MFQFNILIVYSHEKERRKLTSFLYDNGFNVVASYHAIEEIGPTKVYPDIAIIQPGIHSFLKIVSGIKKRFPSVRTLCSNGLLNSSLHFNGFSYNELNEILKEERLFKKKGLIKCVEQIEVASFYQNAKLPDESHEGNPKKSKLVFI